MKLIVFTLTASIVVAGESQEHLALRDTSVTAAEVAHTYDEMLSRNAVERAQAFHLLSPPMKSAVWSRHLLTALMEHDELTSEQRTVIQDALSLLTPALFEIDESSPDWPERVDQPLRRLTQRAKAAFGGKLARELFGQLGPDGAQQKSDVPTCECSIFSDYCDTTGLGMYYCSQSGGCYFSTSGCGTFWQYACNGMCRINPQ